MFYTKRYIYYKEFGSTVIDFMPKFFFSPILILPIHLGSLQHGHAAPGCQVCWFSVPTLTISKHLLQEVPLDSTYITRDQASDVTGFQYAITSLFLHCYFELGVRLREQEQRSVFWSARTQSTTLGQFLNNLWKIPSSIWLIFKALISSKCPIFINTNNVVGATLVEKSGI